mmetsp:Transcript_61921/g.178235  ORF Transcript_61921/g.178235 Transcript_61921/m.178235 type:complete len:299 (-) Transcript_61921:182-1078(-)
MHLQVERGRRLGPRPPPEILHVLPVGARVLVGLLLLRVRLRQCASARRLPGVQGPADGSPRLAQQYSACCGSDRVAHVARRPAAPACFRGHAAFAEGVFYAEGVQRHMGGPLLSRQVLDHVGVDCHHLPQHRRKCRRATAGPGGRDCRRDHAHCRGHGLQRRVVVDGVQHSVLLPLVDRYGRHVQLRQRHGAESGGDREHVERPPSHSEKGLRDDGVVFPVIGGSRRVYCAGDDCRLRLLGHGAQRRSLSRALYRGGLLDLVHVYDGSLDYGQVYARASVDQFVELRTGYGTSASAHH